jgi:molybdopterin/thiamine biosynthesis adenylyltransferase
VRPWLKRIDRNINGEIERALYLPLTQPVRPPFPKTNFELNKTLKSGNKAALADLYAYLEESQSRMSYVIFSFEVNAYHTLGGWIHIRPPSGKKPLCPGFRDHKIRGEVQLTSCFGRRELIKAGVDRVDGNRLQARVGNRKTASIGDKRVLIAGCGSIGSKIALNLALSGINKFILVDNEKFSIENVARHICNMSMVGVKKVDSVAEVIQAHMPHVEIQKEANDFYDMIADHSDILEQCDLIISAIGDRNLNLRLNGIHIAKCQDTAALYVWTEVFGYASHSILVAPHAGGCLNCIMDDDYQFRHRVVMLSASETSKQEAGCGSSFLPYGVMDADIAAGTASRLGLSYLMGEIRRSVRWVYLGDLEKASEQKIPISSHYQSSGCNRLIKHSLTSNSACSVCCVRVRHAL